MKLHSLSKYLQIRLSGEKTIKICTTGNKNNQVTVVLACRGDGSKIKPMVIFKRKTVPKINNKHGVIMSAQERVDGFRPDESVDWESMAVVVPRTGEEKPACLWCLRSACDRFHESNVQTREYWSCCDSWWFNFATCMHYTQLNMVHDLSHKTGPTLQPVFVSKQKLEQELKPREVKPSIVKQQCIV